MFMVQKNEAQKEQLEKILKKIKVIYGAIPPQMEFLGNIEVDYLKMFLTAVLRIAKHPHIEPDLFAFIRLHIAFKEDYPYCKMFNTKILLAKGYTQKQLNDVITDIASVPFNEKHQILAIKSIKAIYGSKLFSKEDFDQLYNLGWTQKDVFDVIDHAGTIFRNGRILTTYAIKD
jgi:hypothetical protein